MPNSCAKNVVKVTKRLDFDEHNISEINRPINKNYGFMTIPDTKTPYPRHVNPIEAKELTKHLTAEIDRAKLPFKHSSESSMPGTVSKHSSISVTVDPARQIRHAEFVTKRQEFTKSEFV